MLSVLAVYAAGRLLSRKGTYTRTMRTLGFAQATLLLELLTFIPVIAPVVRVVTTLLHFIAVWIAASEAHETRGWRTIIFPLVAIAVLVGIFIAIAAIGGALSLTADSILGVFGWTPAS